MERYLARDDEDDWDDDEEDDLDDDDHSTITCPNCRKSVYDDVEQCPYCGHFISDEERSGGKSLLVIVGVILCLAVVVFWLLV
jgi:zinc-ribbon domain